MPGGSEATEGVGRLAPGPRSVRLGGGCACPAMFWYTVLAIAAALCLWSVASPTLRRVWAFSLYAAKYMLLGLFDVLRLRKLWARVRGVSYERLTGPVAARLFCEDPRRFGQLRFVTSFGLLVRDDSPEIRVHDQDCVAAGTLELELAFQLGHTDYSSCWLCDSRVGTDE